jgi:hypothetical protein
MAKWVDVPLNKKLFKNLPEEVLTSTYGALENCFVTESNGLSRFPGLTEFVDLSTEAFIHLWRHDNNLLAVGEDGRTFIIDENAAVKTISGPPVLGGDRVSFARTRDGTMMAAGAQIIKMNGVENSVLSKDAPLSSFVGYIDGYVIAVEKNSGRFQHAKVNEFGVWNPLDTFAVDGSPDDIGAMLITPFNEILFAGEESLEQYERYVGSDVPFFRRWSVGDGISEPWTLCFADNAVWGLNGRREFVRFSGQTSQVVSDDIQKEIENRYALGNIGALNKAWASACYIKGQKFIIFQAPDAGNTYGSKGITLVFDIRRGQWFELYGWDSQNGVPDLWPGRSIFSLWGKTFVGGAGKVYVLDENASTNNGSVQRVYCRTAHFDTAGTMRCDGVRLTMKRGVGTYEFNPKITFRTNIDNKGWNNWQTREIGKIGAEYLAIEFGAQGTGDTFQFEIQMSDNAPFELRRMQIDVAQVIR